MASSSGTSSVPVKPPKEKYDVFISFRGTDTRQTFTSYLYDALIKRKVETYIDDRLEIGDELGPALLEAIKESKISVIIFSENYAGSTWCLDELAYILECKENHGRHVIPIFYEVEPSHVRHQTGTYETAFAQHKKWLKDDKSDKMAKWKEALVKAANISGFDSASKTVRHDADLVDQVVAKVLAKLNRESSTDLTGLIGAEGRIKKILLELDMVPEDVRVRFLVLWGMGGVGKTTLADAVFHRLSSNFESHCFLANVREQSGTKGASSPELYALRDKLLRKLLGDSSLTIDTPTIDAYQKDRLQRSKVLVVLDDVNDSSQLTFLAEEVPFGPGSRIIITTRDLQPVQVTLVLNEVADRDVKIYEVEKLNEDESLRLFYSNQSDSPTRWTENSESLRRRVLDYADGIPLALNILRSLFLQWKGEPEQFWDKLKMFPSEKLQKVYRASYDGLGENEKEIFLDIACFHKTQELCDAKRIMAACGLFPDDGIEILIDMSLISIKDDCLWMHDVIQEMGREIVRQECVEDPGKRSRLYTFKDVRHVLERNKGTAAVKSISLKMAQNSGNVMLTGKAFTEMDNLRFLDFGSGDINVDVNTDIECLPDALKFLSWPGYPFKSLPSYFSPENLVELHMRRSRLQGLRNQDQKRPKNLRRIDLSGSSELTEVPDLSNCVYIESINLAGCYALSQIPSYFRNLTKLTDLNLRGCSNVKKLPELPCNLILLDLNGTALVELPSSIWSMEKLVELDLHSYGGNIPNVTWNLKSVTSLVLTGTRVKSVPSSIENLSKVVSVELRVCKSLVSLPTTICKLKSLERLDLYGCTELKIFPNIAEPMERLEFLCLQKTGIEELPPSIANLVGLKTLDLTWCDRLELVPSGLYKLKHLEHFLLGYCRELTELPVSSTSLCWLRSLDLYDCNLLKAIPEGLICSPSLQSLNLCGNRTVTTIPETIKNSGLTYLNIKGCKQLCSLPELPYHLKVLIADGCTSLEKVSRTAWKGVLFEELTYFKRHTFCGCFNLDGTARSNIMEDAQIRILRSVNYVRSKIMENAGIRYTRSANYHTSELGEAYATPAITVWPGNEIPRWFSCQTEGSIINIKLPMCSELGNVLGIALCVVVTIHKASYLKISCESIFTTKKGGERRRVNSVSEEQTFWVPAAESPDHILVWYTPNRDEEVYRTTEASFDFYIGLDPTIYDRRQNNLIKVKRCGVSFVYPEGHDVGLKFGVVHPVEDYSHQ